MRYRYALGLLALCVVAQAHAQTYPARAIRLISPFPPGGGSSGEFAAFIGVEMARWGKVVREAGVQPE